MLTYFISLNMNDPVVLKCPTFDGRVLGLFLRWTIGYLDRLADQQL